MAGVDCSIGRLDELFLPSVACTDAVGAGEALLRCEVSSHRSKAKEGFLSSLIFFFFFRRRRALSPNDRSENGDLESMGCRSGGYFEPSSRKKPRRE